MAQSPALPGSVVTRYDRVARLARGRGVLEFLQLAGGSTYVQLHLDEWRIVERNYTDSEKCMGS